MTTPIVYTFSGVGSGTLGATPFTDQPFVIAALADASKVYQNSILYPVPTTQIDLPQSTVMISISGSSSAIIQPSLSLALLFNPQRKPYQFTIGIAPDQLLAVTNPVFEHAALNKTVEITKGAGSISRKPYGTSGGSLVFSSISSAEFGATLL